MKSKYGFTDAQTFFYTLRQVDPFCSHVNGRQPLVPVSVEDRKLVAAALNGGDQGKLKHLIDVAMQAPGQTTK